MAISGRGFAGATLAAKSSLAQARVVATSFAQHHPDAPFFVLLADEAEGYFDPADEAYRTLFLDDLDIPDVARFRFSFTSQELTYAATPFLIARLLDFGFERLLFIKQESLVLGELESVVADLPEGGVALTPHLLAPLEGGDGAERELTILLAGVFNAGFVGVAAGADSARFLRWWQNRVYRNCRYAVAEGIHYEQRWLDLAPAYFERIKILHDAGLNVGHWNLPDRRVTVADGSVRAEGRECRLFRFSGYDPDHPEYATRYSPRLRTVELGHAAAVSSVAVRVRPLRQRCPHSGRRARHLQTARRRYMLRGPLRHAAPEQLLCMAERTCRWSTRTNSLLVRRLRRATRSAGCIPACPRTPPACLRPLDSVGRGQ